MRIPHRLRPPALAAIAVVALSACAGPGEPTTPAASPDATMQAASAPEVANARLGITYDGGVMIVEEESMKHLADLPLDGFLRLNAAGDKRHLLVSTGEGFHVLDTGVEVRGHDDHFHLYGHEPKLTETVFPAPKPGHAVVHAGRLALFSDGAGTIQVLDPHEITKGPEAASETVLEPHHGIAIPVQGGMIVSLPDRSGVNVLDENGAVLATTTECPGLHGEAAAREAVSVGCNDGTLVIRGTEITKVPAPDAYGRLGNQAGSPVSDYVLADYKVDKEATLERPTRVALIDTTADSLRLVELPASYSFRSLGRGPNGEALVLTTDGNLAVIDPEQATITESIKVTEPWEESETWQHPRPALRVVGNIAYVTEPGSSQLHAVHLPSAKAVDSVTLPHVPNEIQDVGLADAHGDEADGDHDGHDHGDDADGDHEGHDHE
ncbi:MAG TPA: hypothetical protein GXZ30_01490 [Propionibacterium sp.]|nr:hypothetical protein [Propionibacterium sp.]